MLEIPFRELSPDALRGVLEEYATRGGFDSDLSLDERIDELIEKLKTGKAKIMYDPNEGTTNLIAS